MKQTSPQTASRGNAPIARRLHILLAVFFAWAGLLSGCGEPPAVKTGSGDSQQAAAPEASATPAAAQPAAPLPGATQKIVFTPAPVNRAVLPTDAPRGAEIVTNITPGIYGGKLSISLASEPKTLNPVTYTDATSSFIASLQFSALYGYDQYEQKDTPALAKAWEYNPDTREWTFHLREGVRWSDGQPLTADDFIFFTEVIFDPKVPNDEHLSFRLEPKPDSPRYEFKAPDPYTLVVKIPGVDSFAFLNLGLMRALPRHVFEKSLKAGTFAETWGMNTNPTELVVSGPYKLREIRPGEAIIFDRNPQYWRYDTKGQRLPYIPQIVFNIVGDVEATEMRFLLAGDTDILEGIRPENLARFLDAQKTKNFTVYKLGPSLNVNYYYFNLNQGGTYTDADGKKQVWQPSKPGETPPSEFKDFTPFVSPVKMAWFNNPEFRIACSEATDRQGIINTILYGEGVPLYGMESPSNKTWANPKITTFPYNPESAKKRLEKMGLIDRDNDGVREDAQGNQARFTIITNRENNTREKVAQQLRESLRKVGLGVDVQVLQFNNLLPKLQSTFDFDCCLLGLATGVPPHPAMGMNTWLSSGRMHAWYPEQKAPQTPWEAEIDQLFVSLKSKFTLQEQQQVFYKMQDILAAQQPVISLFSANAYIAAKNNLGNLKPTVIRVSATHNIDELYFKPTPPAAPAAPVKR